MLSWGIGYATQDTLLKAIVAGLLPEGRRNLAFGMFYAGYGVVAMQLMSLPMFAAAERDRRCR